MAPERMARRSLVAIYRTGACLAAALAAASVLSAQQAGPAQPAGTGVVLGRVIDAASSAPLAGVIVTLVPSAGPTGTTPPPIRNILTDQQGRFVFRLVSQGS